MPRDLTNTKRAILEYLSPLMEASAMMLGEHLLKKGLTKAAYPEEFASKLCRDLRDAGFVTRLPELRAWRITAAGREALKGGGDVG